MPCHVVHACHTSARPWLAHLPDCLQGLLGDVKFLDRLKALDAKAVQLSTLDTVRACLELPELQPPAAAAASKAAAALIAWMRAFAQYCTVVAAVGPKQAELAAAEKVAAAAQQGLQVQEAALSQVCRVAIVCVPQCHQRCCDACELLAQTAMLSAIPSPGTAQSNQVHVVTYP